MCEARNRGGMKPYYEHNGIAIYHGDCREILLSLPDGVVIADPVYPRLDYGWEFVCPSRLGLRCRQFYFWMNLEPFPLAPSAIHIWAKSNVYVGDAEQFETIYEVNGKRVCSVMREAAINSTVAAEMSDDVFYGHPCQKPLKLMVRLLKKTSGIVIDPFMGSGTTLVAAKKLGRKAIGIEIEEKHCEIAAKRLSQEVFDFNTRTIATVDADGG